MTFIVRAGGIPTAWPDDGEVRVEIAFGSGFSDTIASRVYTDVTAYVDAGVGIEITHGRSDERSTPEPGSCSLTLANKDGRFTPENAASPYFPNVKKGKPIRVSVKYAGVWYVRFTGYIDEWPLTWPTGGDAEASINIQCSTRRARLGKFAELTMSPIRYAYMLPTEPQAYWPMNYTRVTTSGQEVFLDETNLGQNNQTTQNRIAMFYDAPAYQPTYLVNPRTGPLDENKENSDGQPIGLLMMPKFTNPALILSVPHYIGAGSACRIGTNGDLTIEIVARMDVPAEDGAYALVQLIRLMSADGTQMIVVDIFANGTGTAETGVSCGIYINTDGAPGYEHYEDTAVGYSPAAFASATDGEIHHYAFTLTGGTTGKLYLDGVVVATVTFPAPYVFTDDFVGLLLSETNLRSPAWIGHCAVRDEALSAADIALHAAAATTRDESIDERLTRILGYAGVPAEEVTAETSVALGVGEQSQVDRAPGEIIDELAESTAGIFYDKRDGTIHMQARNHRYNQTAAFTLSAANQEIEADLAAVLDDRYLVNYVEMKRAQVDELPYFFHDTTSMDDYGTYSGGTVEMVTTSLEEAAAAGVSLIVRYAVPKVRVSNVAVDLGDLSATKRAAALDADIGTLFSITNLPAQAPSSTMALYMEGYSESLSLAAHTLTMNTTPGDWDTNVAVLDDASHDALDSGIALAY